MGSHSYWRRGPCILSNLVLLVSLDEQTFIARLKIGVRLLVLFNTTWPYFFDGVFKNASLVGSNVADHTQVVGVSWAQNKSLHILHWVTSAQDNCGFVVNFARYVKSRSHSFFKLLPWPMVVCSIELIQQF